MTDTQLLNKIIEIVYSTDQNGYPLRPHTKIARLQILLEKNTVQIIPTKQ